MARETAPTTLESLRYPIGRFTASPPYSPAQIAANCERLEVLPGHLRATVETLTPAQLDTAYRPGGWTVRQVVHHLPDSHANAYARFRPHALLVGASCTAELIQDDPGGLARALDLPVPVIPLELPAYQKKENWGAAETFYQLVRQLTPKTRAERPAGSAPRSSSRVTSSAR